MPATVPNSQAVTPSITDSHQTLLSLDKLLPGRLPSLKKIQTPRPMGRINRLTVHYPGGQGSQESGLPQGHQALGCGASSEPGKPSA